MPVFIFITTIFFGFFVTAAIILLMTKYKVVDRPKREKRKIHKKTIPLGGGVSPYLITMCALIFLYAYNFIGEQVVPRHLIGIMIGATLIIVGGILDDIKNLKPWQQILFPTLAALVVIGFGIGPHEITNPLGGTFALNKYSISFGSLGTFVIIADLLVFLWLMGVMYTTKLLDGLDGLVSGIAVIGGGIIFFLTQQPQWFQPEVGLIALTFSGAMFGFLIWNWNPAKIFLGEGGSLFAGFILGILAIISGSKIATTLLVLAIPILDLVRVFFVRIKNKKPFYVGDKEHLHFKLLAKGYSYKKVVLLFYLLSLAFGLVGVFGQHKNKLITLAGLLFIVLFMILFFSKKNK